MKKTLKCKLISINNAIYFISDREIKNGDYFLYNDMIYQATKLTYSCGYLGMFTNRNEWIYQEYIKNRVEATEKFLVSSHSLPIIPKEFISTYNDNLNNPITDVELLMTSCELDHEISWDIAILKLNNEVIIDSYNKQYTQIEWVINYLENRTPEEAEEDKRIFDEISERFSKEDETENKIQEKNSICLNCKRVFYIEPKQCFECNGKSFAPTLATVTDDSEDIHDFIADYLGIIKEEIGFHDGRNFHVPVGDVVEMLKTYKN